MKQRQQTFSCFLKTLRIQTRSQAGMAKQRRQSRKESAIKPHIAGESSHFLSLPPLLVPAPVFSVSIPSLWTEGYAFEGPYRLAGSVKLLGRSENKVSFIWQQDRYPVIQATAEKGVLAGSIDRMAPQISPQLAIAFAMFPVVCSMDAYATD